MANKILNARTAQKRDSEANWNKATGFIPMSGEIIVYEADETHSNPRIKVGDGETNVINLPFLVSESAETAESADKLNSNAGSTIKPIYFENGVPVEIAYVINKSVPATAVFTDTTYSLQSEGSKIKFIDSNSSITEIDLATMVETGGSSISIKRWS